MTLKIAANTKNAMLNAIAAAVDGGAGAGTIKIYSGTQPVTADTALSGNTLLATLTTADPAFSAAAAGSITLDADPDLSALAVATGTATFARVADSDGVTVFDGTVGTSGTDFIVTSASITSGQTVTLTTGTIS
jgi:hypothetical protein